MRKADKSEQLYQRLKADIVKGRYPLGMRLSTEVDLAQQYNVSRGTLRTTLCQLEKDALITRIKGHGTYVRKSSHESPITFLLPCPDYLLRAGFVSGNWHTGVLSGVMQFAQMHDYRVETVPVSPSNNPRDIDWSKLNFLNETSRVILSSYWYEPLFELLLKKNCRVGACVRGINPKEKQPLSENWVRVQTDVRLGIYNATKHLLDHGCKHPALAVADLKNPRFSVREGYRKALREIQPYELDLTAVHTVEKIESGLFRNYWERNPFDGLIINVPMALRNSCNNSRLNQRLELPDDVKIITILEYDFNCREKPEIPWIDYSPFNMGYEAAARISSVCLEPEEIFYPGVVKTGDEFKIYIQQEMAV